MLINLFFPYLLEIIPSTGLIKFNNGFLSREYMFKVSRINLDSLAALSASVSFKSTSERLFIVILDLFTFFKGIQLRKVYVA